VSVADVTCVRTFCRIRLEMPSDSDLDWRAIDLALRPVAAGEAIFQTESHGEQNIGFLYFSDGKSHLPQPLGLLVRNEHHVHVAGELQPSGEELNTLFAGGDERHHALAEVELRVLARQPLEANDRLLTRLGPQLLHECRRLASPALKTPLTSAPQRFGGGQCRLTL
jgi:hypothetical protein